MIRAPWFWQEQSLAARTITTGLTPVSMIYDAAQRARWKLTTPKAAPVPVICIGNATLGGVGKTPFAIALANQLAKSARCHFLTRGYGGALNGPILVDPDKHGVVEVGDEALLLTAHGPVWVSKDRPNGANAAAENGADLIIMDDGFQNPTIEKAVSILLIDAENTGGSNKVFPAGPFREPLTRAQSRADIIVYVGDSEISALDAAKKDDRDFAAWLEPAVGLTPRRVIAFSGIGRPEKFYQSLEGAGFDIAARTSFPDHHQFRDMELSALKKLSEKQDAPLITTQKDYVRLPDEFRKNVLTFPVVMRINQPELLAQTVRRSIDRSQGAA